MNNFTVTKVTRTDEAVELISGRSATPTLDNLKPENQRKEAEARARYHQGAQHTPGPWKVLPFYGNGGENLLGFEVIQEGNRDTSDRVAILKLSDAYRDERETTESNARLIAAAPETARERDALKEANQSLAKTVSDLNLEYKRVCELQEKAETECGELNAELTLEKEAYARVSESKAYEISECVKQREALKAELTRVNSAYATAKANGVEALNNYEAANVRANKFRLLLVALFEDWKTLVGEDLKEENEDVARLWNRTEKALKADK